MILRSLSFLSVSLFFPRGSVYSDTASCFHSRFSAFCQRFPPMSSHSSRNRRSFLKTTAAGSAAALSSSLFVSGSSAKASLSPLEKLNIACIGTANRAAEDVNGVMNENIVAIVDVDSNYLNKAKAMLTEKNKLEPRTYADYREMIEKEGDKIDAVVICTADHHHAPASIRAIRAGKHVYCEKPLTDTVFEARRSPRKPGNVASRLSWGLRFTPKTTIVELSKSFRPASWAM